MPDPFATTTGRCIIVTLCVTGGAVGGGYVTSDGLEKRLADARQEGRISALEQMVGAMGSEVKSNTKELTNLSRIVDQHSTRIGNIERLIP